MRRPSAEHESLVAVFRSMLVVFGNFEASRRATGLLHFMGVRDHNDLSPMGANYCRRHLEKQLPECDA